RGISMLKTQKIEYKDGDTILEGYYAVTGNITSPVPAVLIAHDWSGRTESVCKKAEELAELGYLGFALDLYGKGKFGNTKEEKMALIQPFLEDRAKLQQRILAAYNTVKQLENVDNQKIGAIGFCFGGLCVLDLARTGEDIKGVVSFHGLFFPPP